MRKFRRPRVTPPTLSAAGPGGRTRSRLYDLYKDKKGPPFGFPGHWRAPDVIGMLYAMQGRVCAYCGADIEETGIDVEHFRPKGKVDGDKTFGGYWWLAYSFQNYLLSCTICNQKNKRTVFPVRPGTTRAAVDGDLKAEAAILLEPTLDDVERMIYFDWTQTSGRLGSRSGIPAEERARVESSLELFRVNRKASQRKRRIKLQQFVISKLDERDFDEVRGLAIRYRPHSIVAKEILEEVAPEALPTAEEELRWLFTSLASDFALKLEDLNSGRATDIDKAEAEELLWALAALWRDPPGCSEGLVEQMLSEWGLKEVVQEYRDEI